MTILRFLILAFLVLLTGCASVPEWFFPEGPVPHPPRFSVLENEPGSAIVYVYRLHTPPYMKKPDIKVGDVVVVELPTSSYTALRLKPGTYTLKIDWGFLDNLILSRSATLSVEAGKSYYVNFAGKFLGTVATYGAHVLGGEATSIPPELSTCSYVAPQVSMLGPQ